MFKKPSNLNLTIFFNSGSFLGFILMMQILSGLLIAMLFNPSISTFYVLLEHSLMNFFFFLLRFFHSNGASFFFILIIFHIFRNLIYSSFLKKKIFSMGIFIYLILMMTSFFGYVLPWGQMSFWGSSVITNFLSVLDMKLVYFLWGDFLPSDKMIFFFFALHFILPFLILILSILHILVLFEFRSSSSSKKPMFVKKKLNGFLVKDLNNLILIFFFYIFIYMFFFFLGDSENFIESNKMVTPNHIKPEWYFLWAYSILRCIPSKLGGVLMLIFSIFFFLKFIFFKKNKSNKKKMFFMMFILIILTFLGGQVVEMPFILFSQIFTFLYFLNIIL